MSHLPERKRYTHYRTEHHLLGQARPLVEARRWAQRALEVHLLAYRLVQGMISLRYRASVVRSLR